MAGSDHVDRMPGLDDLLISPVGIAAVPPLGPLWTSGIAGNDRMAAGKRCGRRTVEGSAGILRYGTVPFWSPIPVVEARESQVGSRLRSAATAGTMGWTRVPHRAFGLQQRYRVR